VRFLYIYNNLYQFNEMILKPFAFESDQKFLHFIFICPLFVVYAMLYLEFQNDYEMKIFFLAFVYLIQISFQKVAYFIFIFMYISFIESNFFLDYHRKFHDKLLYCLYYLHFSFSKDHLFFSCDYSLLSQYQNLME
jgi:hypothetical protein